MGVRGSRAAQKRAMPTMQKRDSASMLAEHIAMDFTAPQLKHRKSDPRNAMDKSEPRNAMDCTSDLLAAVAANRLDSGVDEVFAELFTADVVWDVSGAQDAGVAAYRLYTGIQDLKLWFAFASGFEYEGLKFSHSAGPAPNEVWVQWSARRAVDKKSGKGVPMHAIGLLTWRGNLCCKSAMDVYNFA